MVAMIRLILNPGRPDERTIPLTAGTHTIGRAPENEIAILNHSLSRRHARIGRSGDEWFVEDLESKNGTHVDGARVTRRALQGGETIKCGDVVMRVETGATAPAVAPAPVAAPTVVRSIHEDLTRMGLARLLGGAPEGLRSALNLRQGNEGDRAQDKLRVLLKVSQALSTPEPIDKQLDKILDLLVQILDVDRAAILLVAEGGKLEPRVVRARDPNDTDATFSQSIVGYVRDNSVAALFSDATHDPRLQAAHSVFGFSIQASMCAPLKPRDEVLGVLYVDNRTSPNRFQEEDLEFLSAFANQAAIALENSTLLERLEREAVRRNNLLRFFPPSTAARFADQAGTSLEPIETEVTALFSDISGFTAMSTAMKPREVVELLNQYFPPMADIVFKHEGTLEKYIGDALLAVWGAPFRHEEDPRRAVQAAIDMQRALSDFNARRATQPPLRIHIGINTGPVAAGNIGSAHYIQYATIGDTTNVASRICNAAVAGEILLSDTTLKRIGKGVFPTEAHPAIHAKGKEGSLEVHRVVWDTERE